MDSEYRLQTPDSKQQRIRIHIVRGKTIASIQSSIQNTKQTEWDQRHAMVNAKCMSKPQNLGWCWMLNAEGTQYTIHIYIVKSKNF